MQTQPNNNTITIVSKNGYHAASFCTEPALEIIPHLQHPGMVAMFGPQAVDQKLRKLDEEFQKIHISFPVKAIFIGSSVLLVCISAFSMLGDLSGGGDVQEDSGKDCNGQDDCGDMGEMDAGKIVFGLVGMLLMGVFLYLTCGIAKRQKEFVFNHFADWQARGVDVSYDAGTSASEHQSARPTKITLVLPALQGGTTQPGAMLMQQQGGGQPMMMMQQTGQQQLVYPVPQGGQPMMMMQQAGQQQMVYPVPQGGGQPMMMMQQAGQQQMVYPVPQGGEQPMMMKG
jgi:hypothetical protein